MRDKAMLIFPNVFKVETVARVIWLKSVAKPFLLFVVKVKLHTWQKLKTLSGVFFYGFYANLVHAT